MKFSFLFLYFFISLGGFSQQLCGLVLDSVTKKNLSNCKVFITTPLIDSTFEEALPEIQEKCHWFEGNYFLKLANTVTNSLGQYHFSNIKPGNYVIIAEYKMPVRSAVSNIIKPGRKKVVVKEIYSMVTCPYGKTKEQIFCPNCKNINKVQEIF